MPGAATSDLDLLIAVMAQEPTRAVRERDHKLLRRNPPAIAFMCDGSRKLRSKSVSCRSPDT